ncbi:MAG: hypothetical protein EOP00_17240 [Pedobacter sp.]|nr:MAG: hypothetical protein EOP00_17240 [Pedobacter sp.]
MEILLHPSYFPSISHFVAMAQSEKIALEMEDNFQKQTNRNRMYIYSPNGVQLLNIPIKHSALTAHQKTKDVQLETAFDWQKQHFKSLEAAYRSSPFFEFFEDDIMPIFEKKHNYLMDLNLQTMEIVCKCLGMSFQPEKTIEYFKEPSQTDFRSLINGKKDLLKFDEYPQVFEEKYGYINNLSILDLLFNEGRHALSYLKNQRL